MESATFSEHSSPHSTPFAMRSASISCARLATTDLLPPSAYTVTSAPNVTRTATLSHCLRASNCVFTAACTHCNRVTAVPSSSFMVMDMDALMSTQKITTAGGHAG